MRTGRFCTLFTALSLISYASAYVWTRQISVVGEAFFDEFTWEVENDPTNGRVNYLSETAARTSNLTYATAEKFFMRPDSTNVVAAGARGRDSIRIHSNWAYDESVVILDLQHMPYGCGTWPAFWSLSSVGPWPNGGEIDIIEGVNNAENNLVSLHTTPNCVVPQTRDQTGNTTSTNCDTTINFNQGCSTQDSSTSSYGAGFNEIGGGYYVLARTQTEGIRVWFWPRSDLFTPMDVVVDSSSVDPELWGWPVAYFPTTQCDYASHFNAHQLVFDLTFCGDWAGAPDVWGSSGCSPLSCNEFVDSHPEAFADAFWEVNSLRVYTHA